MSRVERLEVDAGARKVVDIGNIVPDKKDLVPPLGSRPLVHRAEKPVSQDFQDDPDVPPLE